MKKIKLLSLCLTLLMVFALFAGCGKTEPTAGKTDNGKVESEKSNVATDKNENAYNDFPQGLKAEKIGSISVDSLYTTSTGGLYYRDANGKYGIMDYEGNNDTGANYTRCEAIGNNFQVTTSTAEITDDAANLNRFGLVDVNGKEIIPMKFAGFKSLNDRYVQAIEVTEKTDNEDEAIFYVTSQMFSLTPGEDDILFKGKWQVYDLTTGKPVEGVAGTNKYAIIVYEDVIKYYTDERAEVVVNSKGEAIPEDAVVFDNGCYSIDKDNVITVYDSDNNKLFECGSDDYKPRSFNDGYYTASKNVDNEFKYVLLNDKGEVVSAEYPKSPYVYGELVHCDNKVYDFEGKIVIDGTFESVYLDKHFEKIWFLKTGSDVTMIKKDGTVIYKGTEKDNLYIDKTSYFLISNKIDDKTKYYSLKDKDFTLEGNSLAPWLVKKYEDDSSVSVYDTISGEKIISGYSDYSAASVFGSAIYVYARNEDDTKDVYIVK